MTPASRYLLLLVWPFILGGCPLSDSDDDQVLQSGLQQMQSNGVMREYYLQLPSDYYFDDVLSPIALGDPRPPLLIAFHGYTGSLDNFVGPNRFYDLIDRVGDEAIMVFPNALFDGNGDRNWNTSSDPGFFLDLLAELDRRGLDYNPNKIFITGHSNGAGLVHQLACSFGDIIRAAAPVAGNLINNDCVGSVAIMMTQGNNDPLVDISLVHQAEQYWALYNGWDVGLTTPSAITPCIDYSMPGELNSDYPVLWCEHSQFHDWPDFASDAIWQFFSSLREVEPTPDFPDGGGNARATPPSDTTVTFRVQLPDTINRPLTGAVTLRPLDFINNPTCSIPTMFLNTNFSLDGVAAPGQVSGEITVPISYPLIPIIYSVPSDWAFSLTIYVEGGSRPIPAPGVDHDALVPVTITDKFAPLVIDDLIAVVPVVPLCG